MDLKNLDAVLDGFIAAGIPGNDCIVKLHGETVYRRFRGVSDLETRTPMNGSERYNIYSCSKVFTVICVMQLLEKGLISLDAKLSDYMPEYADMKVRDGDTLRSAKTPITVRHMLTMTAGLDYNTSSASLNELSRLTEGRCPTLQAAECIAREPLCFEPGTVWQYSLCHDVLAALVEKMTGMRFGEYARRNIFEPLGMDRTTFLLPAEELDGIAAQYRFNEATGHYDNVGKEVSHGDPAMRPYKLGTEYESGGAGAISTVEDYSLFLEALRADRLISRETRELMTTDMLDDSTRPWFWSTPAYGYGLGVRCHREGSKYTDYGWGGAAGCYLAVDPVNDFTVFYAQHVLKSPIADFRSNIVKAIRRDLNLPHP